MPAYAALIYRFVFYNKVGININFMYLGYHLLNIHFTVIMFICSTLLLLVHIVIFILYKLMPNKRIKVIEYSFLSVVVLCSFFVVGSYFLFNPTENDIKITYNNCINVTNGKESYVFFIFILFYLF